MVTCEIFHNETVTHEFAASQVIFHENPPGDFMDAVIEGEVDIVRHGVILDTVGSGGVFGELALLDGLPRSASAVARVNCRLATISEHRFTQLVSHNPYFALDMMCMLSERLRRNLTA